MANSSYITGFRFMLSFPGEDAAFQEVSGISKEMNVEEVACGGENRFKYRLPIVSSSQNLVLKRARVPESSSLVNWCINTLDKSLTYDFSPENVTVSLLDEQGNPTMKWLFHNAYPIKYAVSDLKSDQSQLLIESIELAYSYFEIPN